MGKYSYPYHKSTHLNLTRTILLPLIVSACLLLLAVPTAMSLALSARSRSACNEANERLSSAMDSYTAGIVELSRSSEIENYVTTGEGRTTVFRLLYDFRNDQSFFSDFQLANNSGAIFAGENYGIGDISSYRAIQDVRLRIRLNTYSGPVEHRILLAYSPLASRYPVYSVNHPVGEDDGLLSFIFTRESFSGLFNDISGSLVIVNEYDYIVFETSNKLSGRLIPEKIIGNIYKVDGGLYLLHSAEVSGTLMRIYSLSSLSDPISALGITMFVTVLILALSAIFIYRASFRVTVNTLALMDSFVDALRHFEDGDTAYRIPETDDEETREYTTQFNNLLGDITRLLERNRELAEQTRQFEFRLLYSQFNPHFMFNMLDNIKYVVSEDPERAGHMIVALSKMLRYTLENLNDTKVTLKTDLAYIEDYLTLQKERLGPLFSYEINLANRALLSQKLPKLIMQPPIENCVTHGFTGERPFHIKIDIKPVKGDMVVTIADNGNGMTPEMLSRVRGRLKRGITHTEHIGLLNTHRRLRLLYGAGYGATVNSTPGQGVTITLKIKLGG